MIGDSIEELETSDQPRGVVYAANKYAQEKVGLARMLQTALPGKEESVLETCRMEHEKYWNAFHAGARWAIAHACKVDKP